MDHAVDDQDIENVETDAPRPRRRRKLTARAAGPGFFDAASTQGDAPLPRRVTREKAPTGGDLDLSEPARPRRWLSRATLAVAFLGLAAIFVVLFERLTGNWVVAAAGVGGMLAYMLLAAAWASRDDRGPGNGHGGLG